MKPIGFVVGDSIPMPRVFEPESPRLEQTWPFRLEARLPQYYWIINCRGGRPLTEAPQILETSVYYYRPVFTILSAGIVDCVYRALTPRELAQIRRLPSPVAWLIHRVTKQNHYRLTKARKVPYTSVDDFRRSLKRTADFCQQIKTTLIYVQILAPGTRMKEVSYNVEANVALYNQTAADVLPSAQIVNLSEMREEIDKLVLPDGHHLNALGHERCASKILERLEALGFVG